MTLEGKVALVAGATRGAGRGIAVELGAALSRRARIQGGQLSLDPRVRALIERAENEAKRLGDEFVSTEHLLLAASQAGGDAQRLLDAAELLFARHGYNGVSIRDIAAEARANISSVYYHFDSKQKLLEAVCRRRMVPVVTERKAAIAAAGKTDAAAGDAAARERIADLIAAFVGPTFRAAQGQSREAAP